MTNPNPIPPANAEIVAKWQSEFEVLQSPKLKLTPDMLKQMRSQFGGYNDEYLNGAWQGFLMARQSQPPIKLPQKMWSARAMSDGFNQAIDECTKSIEAHGYAVGRE